MTVVRATENEFRGEVVRWLNELLAQGRFRFERATADPAIRTQLGERRLPDVQIWLNRQGGQGFCGLELKTPETLVNDPALLENAAEKSRAMNADYFVTWNMRDTVIWMTPPSGMSVARDHRKKTYPAIPRIASVDDLWDRVKNGLLQYRAQEILEAIS